MLNKLLIKSILAIALFSLRIPAINFNRITVILLLFSALLLYNTLYIDLVGSGVSVFGKLFQCKLFQVTTVSDCKKLNNFFAILSNRFILTVTLLLIFFNLTSLLSPTPLLNSVPLLTLNQFYW